MKYSEIRDLTTKEIKEFVIEEQKNYTKLKISHAVSPLDNPQKINKSRKQVAKLKTELKKRELSKDGTDGK